MGTLARDLEIEIARHIAALIDQNYRPTDEGGLWFYADNNGDLIHMTTTDVTTGRKDAWVVTVEWDGERDHPANNAPQEAL